MRTRTSDDRTTSTDDERALIERAKLEPAAFAPIYERYYDRVYRYALYCLGDRAVADDLTSQTFLKALAGLQGFRSSSVRGWLFAIAHNLVIDARRASTSRTVWPENWEQADDEPSPEELAVHRDDHRRLTMLLGQLTPEQRDVVELRLAGLNGAEIASQLGLSLAAAKSAQWRAYARLRRLLEIETAAMTEGSYDIR